MQGREETSLNQFPKVYDPAAVEPSWAEYWAQNPVPVTPSSGRPRFVIPMPPPNVTGTLHLGHALEVSLEDALIRYKRMQGFDALWLPGTDHAGIATQIVVERELAKEGKTRFELGREAFLERVWQWCGSSGGTILEQMKRLGASADWSRTAFTLDQPRARAVRYAFIRYFHEGLAFRGKRIVHWDPKTQTTLSDLEVNTVPTPGQLYYIAYPLEAGGELVIATVRPETIFADQAIAVNPADERYQHLIGQKARIPLTERLIPIVADAAVELEFGTGALKVTPAHDVTDFEIGSRHGLAAPSVIDPTGHLSGELVPLQFQGLERFAARTAVALALEQAGFLRGTQDYTIALAVSGRSGAPVEPMLSEQWWLAMAPLAEPVVAGIKAGEIKLIPERWAKVNVDWLENIRDWNISRQLWWGHRIPAWYCPCGALVVPPLETFDQDPTVCPVCGGSDLTQDPDVFDTWFSSALWPMATLGWPEATPDLDSFYPADLLVTGYDILFFWVARMETAGYHFTGRAPFAQVLLHGLILDEKGQKMSKSKNNTVDPLDLIRQYGADAVRFALSYLATGGQDIRLDYRWLDMARNFTNKLYNAARFVLISLENFVPTSGSATLADRWITSRLRQTVAEVSGALDAFDVATAARLLYDFIWSEFCDWYLEAAKPALRAGNPITRTTLLDTINAILRLLHPLMPFLTSELYQNLTGSSELWQEAWPQVAEFPADPAAEADFAVLKDAVTAARSLRAELGLPPAQVIPIYFAGAGEGVIEHNSAVFSFLAHAEPRLGAPERGLRLITPSLTLYLVLEGLVDLEAFRSRQEKLRGELLDRVKRARQKLANPNFVAKAKEDVVASEREKLAQAEAQLERVREALKLLN